MPYSGGYSWTPIVGRHPDRIYRAIRRTVESYRFSTFRLITFTIGVTPAKPEPNDRVARPGQSPLEYGYYIFEPLGKPAVRRLVKLDDKGNVFVKISGKFMPLIEYLRRCPLGEDPTDRSRDFQYVDQLGWWHANGKTFPLLELPGELREKIYQHCLGTFVEPYPTYRHRPVRVRSEINKGLLHVSKQVYAEVKRTLYADTTFFLQHGHLFKKLLQNSLFPYMQLRHLELALSHVAFLSLFGSHLLDKNEGFEVSLPSTQEAATIKKMNLKQLTLYMPHPANLIDAPWTNGCQRTLVNWILDAAWPFVRGHPIRIHGHVTLQQKQEFEAKADREWRETAEWEDLRASIGLDRGDEDDDEDEEEGGISLGPDCAEEQKARTVEDKTLGESVERIERMEIDHTGHDKYEACTLEGCPLDTMARIVYLPPICYCPVSCLESYNWEPIR